MKKILAFLVLLAGLGGYAHYRHWIDLPLAQLPREKLADGARPWRVPYLANLLSPEKTGKTRGERRKPAIPVVAASVRKQDVPVTAETVATAKALNSVVVRPQVDGTLTEISFQEGQIVKQGDILARIDAATYQAQYDQAVAKREQDKAELDNARKDLLRYNTLAKTNFGSKQQADTQLAKVAQLVAQVKLDQALVDNAKTILDRTTIRAPISGRTGLRNVDAGNIVRTSDPLGLVTIAQFKPISVVFNLPQQQLRAISAALARGPVRVEALQGDNTSIIETGVVEVVDNLVDTTTGTVKIKARFENAASGLWPGQFVNVRIYVGLVSDAIVVPVPAVQRGPDGPYVYVIDKDEKAQIRKIVTGQMTETLAVIKTGLSAGERVVVTGFSRLSGGETVRARMQGEKRATPDAASTNAGAPG
jgi:membrane fusion protein, multidrug efflux system